MYEVMITFINYEESILINWLCLFLLLFRIFIRILVDIMLELHVLEFNMFG